MGRSLTLALTLTAVGAGVLATTPAADAATDRARIKVLSNRADLVSGGRALIELKLPAGADASTLRVRLRAGRHLRDVTRRFRPRANGRRIRNLRMLRVGVNRLVVRLEGRRRATARIVNHPIGGPVTSGPQIKPWVCQETAVDRKCNQPVSYELYYRSTEERELQPYDPDDPPDDVAMTTTDQGVKVPFIVRLEIGYQDRDQYKIAMLFQPGKRWRPWAPQRQWNHKLLVTHGAGCGVTYGAGNAPAVFGPLQAGIAGIDELLVHTSDDVGQEALGRGFGVMSTALNNNSHNCNIAVQAESLLMAKERVVEAYGPIRYTIAAGCSGGAVVQQQVANAYPGIYQGLIPQCSYPDTFSPGAQFADYHLLRLYFEDPDRWGSGVAWTPDQFAEVEGHISHANAITADEGLFKRAINPTHECGGLRDEQRYHPDTNPAGVRCDVLSYMINVLGPRPKRVWSQLEHELGRGFAGVPFANVGVQYGLEALKAGRITPAQFVDVNEKIGGLAIEELVRTDERLRGDPSALRNAYRSGAFNSANNLDRVAIINLGGPDPGAAHDYIHAWWMRERLLREHGSVDNYVMWFGSQPIVGNVQFRSQALVQMDRWLAAVERDRRPVRLAEKIVENRPVGLEDRCELVSGADTPGGLCESPAVQTRYGTPRTVAGAGPTADVGACRLRGVRRGEYAPVSFTDAQWRRLRATFPAGVCDWRRPGRGQRDTIAWLTYRGRDGGVVHGGRRLGRAPRGSGQGWTSRAFRSWRRGR